MSGSDQQITKTVKIVVPREVEERARRRAGGDELEAFLLDEFLFEYEWVFEGE